MTTPSKPLNISSPRQQPADELVSGSPASGRLSIGTPSQRQTSTPPIANIPPRYGSPSGLGLPGSLTGGVLRGPVPFRSRTPIVGGTGSAAVGGGGTPVIPPVFLGGGGRDGGSGAGSGATTPTPRGLEDVPSEEMVRVLRRHLVSREERERQGQGDDGRDDENSDDRERSALGSRRESVHDSVAGVAREDSEPFPIPYHAPGGDITHPIYKWQQDQRKQAIARPRSASFHAPTPPVNPILEQLHQPGGFRRNYVIQRANEQGLQEPPVSNNFIEFLYLFGHFAGEDLEDEEGEEDVGVIPDEEAGEEDAALIAGPSLEALASYPGTHKAHMQQESQPLLGSRHSRSRSRVARMRRASVGPHGDATVTQAVLMLLKSFVGTGVLFLGKAFFNGGILFSAVMIVAIALISLYSFLLLVKTKFVVPGSFGDIGGTLYGPWLRYCILTSITVSQLGFVSAYTIFVSENLQAFFLAVTKCAKLIPIPYLILAQLIVFLPLALVRNIAKLSSTALVADVFILAGLVYIFGSEASLIAKRGIAEVKLFNPKDFPLLIGTAVFSFEGIGLVIPITDAMREPRKFPAVLTGVMLFLTVLFGGAGVLAYLAFGPEIQTVVITNLDSESKFVQAVQFLYSLAILLSVPLQLFPAVRIMENGIFSQSGKLDPRVKWEKNIFRFMTVMFCAGVSWAGAKDLDKFVALVGSFACVPLCYIYPPMLHYKAVARTKKEKFFDILLFVFGIVATVYTTVQTIALMAAPEAGGPKFGKCELPPSSLPLPPV